jgi:hypothetical protein
MIFFEIMYQFLKIKNNVLKYPEFFLKIREPFFKKIMNHKIIHELLKKMIFYMEFFEIMKN